MSEMPNEYKAKIIEKRILNEISEFYAQQRKGMEMQMLSAKYAKALIDCGGFPEFIETLRIAGKIRVEYLERGARRCYPGTGVPEERKEPSYSWF